MPPRCGTTEGIPILTAHEVLWIHRQMFTMLMINSRVSEHPIVNLKADPDELPLLVANYDWILPGYHMSKKHWVTVELRAVEVTAAGGLLRSRWTGDRCSRSTAGGRGVVRGCVR